MTSRLNISSLVGILLLTSFISTAQQSHIHAPPLIHNVSADSLKKILSSTDTAHLIILDVRPRAKYQRGHIPGAVSMPLEELPDQFPLLRQSLSSSDTIVVYCGNGQRSAKAIEILRRAQLPVALLCNLQLGLQSWKGPLTTKPESVDSTTSNNVPHSKGKKQ